MFWILLVAFMSLALLISSFFIFIYFLIHPVLRFRAELEKQNKHIVKLNSNEHYTKDIEVAYHLQS